MLSMFKKGKKEEQNQATDASKQDDQFVELKSKAADKDAAKKKSTGCCGSCGGQ